MGVRKAVLGVSGLKGALLSLNSPTKTKVADARLRPSSCGSSWRLSALAGVVVAVFAGVLSAGAVSVAVAADTCANAAVRAQTGSTGLPECRGYEMVSSPYKEGFEASSVGMRFTDDGVFSYGSLGTFAGNPLGSLLNQYHATRSAAGWLSASVAPPHPIYDATDAGGVTGESADLRWSMWRIRSRRGVSGDVPGYYLRGPDGAMTYIGETGLLGVAGTTPDLSHVVYSSGPTPLYEHVGTGNGLPRVASVDNDGQVQGPACLRSISPDGRVIVYSTACPLGESQVWARIGGSVSVEVSASECTRTADDLGGLCNDFSAATYAGGAVDGSRVFFTTRQQLVNEDTDTGSGTDTYAGNDLYACDIPVGVPAPVGSGNACGTLTEVSGMVSDARVENVVSVSEDGSRVYFVAQGVLADNLGVGGVGASAGVPNLYLWQRGGANPTGSIRFVAGGRDEFGGGLVNNDFSRVQMTPDGRYLLFLTANKLVTGGPAADSDDAVDAYRYDAVTKVMMRVSTSVSGGGGNSPGFDVSLILGASSMTSDGSTVILDTAEALSLSDTDGVTDVYAWRDDGGVSLISSGGGQSVGITPSGRDIFFATDVQMLAADRDFSRDIYDARAGGGFAPALATPCSGEGCQGQPSQAPNLAGPSPAGSDGLDAAEVAPTFSLRAVSAAQRRALAATGKASVTVTTNAPGTVNIKETATIAGRSVTVGSARRVLTSAGKAAVSLVLTKKARSQLAARGKLTVRVVVSHSKVALDRSVTLKLVHAKAKAKRSAERASARGPVVGGGGRS